MFFLSQSCVLQTMLNLNFVGLHCCLTMLPAEVILGSSLPVFVGHFLSLQ
jgi:hypothetical protein